MSTVTVNSFDAPRGNANKAIVTSIVLSIGVTLLLWFLQSIFKLSSFVTFLIYIGVLFVLFYFVLPKLTGSNRVHDVDAAVV